MTRSLCLLLALLAATSGCVAPAARTMPSDGPASASGDAGGSIRPGDRVALKIWAEPALSDTFTVAETGVVVLPKLGSMQTEGLEPSVLQDSVQRAYTAFLRDPAVRVSVLRRVGVLGEVRRPGIYMADLTMSVADIIAQAGGLTEAGDPNKIVVQRGAGQIRLSQRDRTQYLEADVKSGDQIVVGARGFWARNPTFVVSSLMSLVAITVPLLTRD